MFVHILAYVNISILYAFKHSFLVCVLSYDISVRKYSGTDFNITSAVK